MPGPTQTHTPEPPSGGSEPPLGKLGRYEILRTVARGGMAEILLARAKGIEGFSKLVVIKRILPELAVNQEFVQMFLDEARLAATLHHSNIVQVFDIGEERGQYFFAMEYLHGQDVRQIATRARQMKRAMTLEQSLGIILGACAGLHHAHEQTGADGQPLGLVHRDVSPHNLFVTYDGGVKLVDFGIAKATQRLTQTRTGTLKGKISYMSPEQCRAHALDRRSDVFSMSILLWELTVGRRLYAQPSDFEIMKAIAELPALAPSAVMPDYPPELENIVLKGLRVDRDLRYQSIEELQLAIEEFARERRLKTSPITLRNMMKDLFRDEIDAWQLAQRAGEDFAAHIIGAMKLNNGEDLDAELEVVPAATRSIPTLTPTLGTDPSLMAPAPLRASRRRLWAGVAAGVVAVAIGGWQLASSGEKAKPAAPPPPTPTAAGPTPAPIEHLVPDPSPPPVPQPATTAAPPVPDAAPAPAAIRPKKKVVPKRATKTETKERPADLDSLLPP